MNATRKEFYVFAGHTGSGKGYRVYYAADGMLDTTGPRRLYAVRVEHQGGEWVEIGPGSLPAEANGLVRDEIQRRVDQALARASRIVTTCVSHDAALACGKTVRVLRDREADCFRLEITHTSRWEGETPAEVTIDPREFSGLDVARRAAEKLCQSPYGDPEWDAAQ